MTVLKERVKIETHKNKAVEIVFIAKDKEGNDIAIEEAVRGGEYFCPNCGGAVIVKAKSSEAVKGHFAHKNKAECDSWNYDMSEWHRAWQNSFPKECQEVVVQKDGIKHRADVLINNTVIEFQHSPITAEEIAERNRFYTECGLKVVWVFDAEGKIKNKNESAATLDPLFCAETDLCWKRPKREFSIKIPENVTIYLQYRTSILGAESSEKEFDVLLLLKQVDSKQIEFYKTIDWTEKPNKVFGSYIFDFNFLKEYGAPLPENFSCPTITEIIQSIEYRRLQRAYQQQLGNGQPKTLLNIPRVTMVLGRVSPVRPYKRRNPRREK